MTKQDLEALVTPKIVAAVQAAIDRVGRSEFASMAEIDNGLLASILESGNQYVPLAVITLACQINKSNGDPDPAHSSVTECLKGTTMRIPTSTQGRSEHILMNSQEGRRIHLPEKESEATGSPYGGKPFRLLGFSVNTITFLVLGYFLGGIVLSPLLGQQSCTGLSTSPPSLDPCAGSVLGIILGAVSGLGYTYYYFVKKL